MVAVGLLVAVSYAEPTASLDEPRLRLEAIRAEISELEATLEALHGKERGILGELERFDAELRLRQTEVREAAARVDEVTQAIDAHDATLGRLGLAQDERRQYLEFRLREIYKAGSNQLPHRLIAGEDPERYWAGLSYASLLSERDARVVKEYRSDAELSVLEREKLKQKRVELAAVHRELADRRDAVAGARRQRSAMLDRVREDEGRQRAALEELRAAAGELSLLAGSLKAGAETSLDILEYKGLLDWPAEGELRAGFGRVIHPEFKTNVPHPGWDIAAGFGGDVTAVFEGTVVFADWMRGYGLTAIVDHGGGVLSIYAHTSLLLVNAGEAVSRGQSLGKVGDTGSLTGPFLYFELRVNGEPVDPGQWLRDR
jgi:septal ring factor EnvC (AmiA/AmiB activator)